MQLSEEITDKITAMRRVQVDSTTEINLFLRADKSVAIDVTHYGNTFMSSRMKLSGDVAATLAHQINGLLDPTANITGVRRDCTDSGANAQA